jgi:SPP1 family predicted phage head-tail adaptor
MQAGKLRHRVAFISITETQDDWGHVGETGTTILATRWTQIEPLSGRELDYWRQIHADVTHKLKIRYLAGLTPKHRATFGSRTFEILSVITKDEIKHEMEVIVKETL